MRCPDDSRSKVEDSALLVWPSVRCALREVIFDPMVIAINHAPKSCKAKAGCWLACPSTAAPACCKIWVLVKVELSCAISASTILAAAEAELSRVDSGHEVVVAPVAYPDLSLKGVVESVGSMAQSMSGRPDWQRYFEVVVALKESDPRLRPGMTVRTRILAGARDAAVLVPRLAVSWDGNKAFCKVMKGAGEQRRDVELGISNDEFFEVLSGLQPGEKVLVR